MSSDGDATRPLGQAGEPRGTTRPVRAPITPAGEHATSERASSGRTGPERASSGRTGPERASSGGPRPTHGPATDATSSFDKFVLRAIHTGGRLARAWRALSAKRRLAAYAAFGLFIGLFLPWYSETVVATGARASAQSVSVSGWGSFSLVQTVVLLVSAGVLLLLFERADGGKRRLPGGDGATIIAAGCATLVLTLWGMFDRPSASGPGQYTTASGIEWGIFLVLALAALLAYAGSQIRAEDQPEPRVWDTRAKAPAGPAKAPAADDDRTRVSERTAARRAAAFDQPTPVSTRRAPVDTPTRVSTRRTGEATTERVGPPVAPEDPPTLRIPPRKRPQDGLSTNEK